MAKLSTILDQIDAGSMLLPEFQRGYVWNRDQVRGLMKSMYHGFPVGALLVWETEGSGQAVRGGTMAAGPKQLLLDGQQRVTTLYGVVRGRAPSFFEGDPDAFAGLRFNVDTEAFQFHAPVKMKGDPRWIDVTALFVEGPGATYALLGAHDETRDRFAEYVDRIARLRNILERAFHVEAITGADKTVDVVVDIFNRVNSGGTKLSKGILRWRGSAPSGATPARLCGSSSRPAANCWPRRRTTSLTSSSPAPARGTGWRRWRSPRRPTSRTCAPRRSPPDHWVVIVKESSTITIGSKKYHLYPADDPLIGRVMVLAPKIGRVGEDALKKAGLKDTGGQLQLSSGTPVRLAYGGGQAFRRLSAKYR